MIILNMKLKQNIKKTAFTEENIILKRQKMSPSNRSKDTKFKYRCIQHTWRKNMKFVQQSAFLEKLFDCKQ